MNQKLTFCSTFLILILLASSVKGQFVEFQQIQWNKRYSSDYKNARTSEVLSLPFWEDFSQGIDSLSWDIEGVSFTETIGNNAPSFGMALFNGVDQNGRPYSLQARDQGEGDFLTSKSFDLSGLNADQRQTVYISFFWQAGGKSEFPDSADELTLQVLTPDQNWATIWSQSGGDDLDRENFTQEILQILPEWQHAGFKFRFFSSGRQSGPFDSWLLDYIFFDSGRDANDLFTLDRALTRPNQVFFEGYAAYPRFLIPDSQEGAWSSVSNEFNNLENRFRAMEFSIVATDSANQLLTFINTNTPFDPVPNTLERRGFESRDFESIDLPAEEADLGFTTFLTSGDDRLFELADGDTIWYDQVNFAINDTVRSIFPIRDFFAYDRGQADYAAGINQRSGQLAVQYTTPEEVYLKGISILFTNPAQANQPIDIQVWDRLDGRARLTKQEIIPDFRDGSQFVYYALDTNIRVSGEFFIGYTQFSNEFIHVGLDKNHDQGAKIFYNVGGGWVQNEEVSGSLMIRPHVSSSPTVEESELPSSALRLFPNPVVDQLTIEGKIEAIQAFDSFGREILLERQKTEKGEIVNFGQRLPGIYVLQIATPTGIETHRILIRN